MRLRSFLAFILSACFVAPTFAQDDLIEAAINDAEPEYITILMEKLSQRIYGFAQNNPIEGEIQMRAWWHTMRAILCVTFAITREAARDAASEGAFDAALETSWGRTWKALMDAAGDTFFDDAWEVAGKTVWSIFIEDIFFFAYHRATNVLNGLSYTQTERDRIALRVAEWTVLIELLRNIESVIMETFDASLLSLVTNPPDTPFVVHNFTNVPENVSLFLNPWVFEPNIAFMLDSGDAY